MFSEKVTHNFLGVFVVDADLFGLQKNTYDLVFACSGKGLVVQSVVQGHDLVIWLPELVHNLAFLT